MATNWCNSALGLIEGNDRSRIYATSQEYCNEIQTASREKQNLLILFQGKREKKNRCVESSVLLLQSAVPT